MNFDVLIIAAIRKIPLNIRPRANYTRRSQEVGLTKRICDNIPVDNWIGGCSLFSVVHQLFFYKSLAKCKTGSFVLYVKKKDRFFRNLSTLHQNQHMYLGSYMASKLLCYLTHETSTYYSWIRQRV